MELTDLCVELNNYFEVTRCIGTFKISGGVIDLSRLLADGSLQRGQFFRIAGSVFNDGVYQYPCTGLTDETFDGAIWPMAVPKAAMGLLADIQAWIEANSTDSQLNSPYQSESFGGYSYSKINNGSGAGASADLGTWQNQFRSRLNKWRKIRAV
jgi:hypothetical protein